MIYKAVAVWLMFQVPFAVLVGRILRCSELPGEAVQVAGQT